MSTIDKEDEEDYDEDEEDEDEDEDEEDYDEDEEDYDEDEEDYDDEDEEEEDLNLEERKIVMTMMFEGKPIKTSEGQTFYDNIIKCLKKKMLNENDKLKEVQKIFLDKITETEVANMAVNRGSLSIYRETLPQTDPTPLFIAAEKGYYTIAELLLSNGADITESVNIKWGKYKGAEYDYYVTPLFIAAMNGHKEIVKALLDKYEEIAPDLTRKYDELNLRPECSRFKKASIDRVDYSSWEWTSKGEKKKDKKKPPTPLFVAAYAGHCNIIKLLVKYKSNINWQDDDGMTALFLATEFGELKTVKCLLEQGANPNITTYEDYYRKTSNGLKLINVRLITPLFMAITRDGTKDKDAYVKFKMVKLLLEHNANVNQPVNRLDNSYIYNITPLHIAVQIAKRSSDFPKKSELFQKILTLLLRYGADINVFDTERPNKMSPLDIVKDDTPGLKDLLVKGDINFKVNNMYKVLLSKNMPEDLAAFQSLDMFDKDHISNLAETIKQKAEEKASDNTAKEKTAKGGTKINKKCKTNTTKPKKQTRKRTSNKTVIVLE